MTRPEASTKNPIIDPEKQQKNIPELLAIVLAFVSVFVFFFKILFF